MVCTNSRARNRRLPADTRVLMLDAVHAVMEFGDALIQPVDESLPVQLDVERVISALELPFTDPATFWTLP